jgi:hypothetical protein
MNNPEQGGQQNQGGQQDQKPGLQQQNPGQGGQQQGRSEARTARAAEVKRNKRHEPQY